MYNLNKLRDHTLRCVKCQLHKTRKNVVFGEGNQDTNIMFIGEGPGHHEDQEGRPFIGPAGKLLDKMIEAIRLKRQDVYITNVVKCRPPNNRTPLEEESNTCIEYLRWQVKLVNPKIIVCLGATSAKNIIRSDFKITKERGKWIKKGDYHIMPTFHPSALLRDATKKKSAWEDFKAIRDTYNQLENIEAE